MQLSSGSRLAFPAELTSMFALPAADVHVRRAISIPRFAEPAFSSCTFRSPQPYATPVRTGRELLSIFIHSQRPAAGVRAGRVVSGLRCTVNFLTSLHKSLSPTAKRCFHRTVAEARAFRSRQSKLAALPEAVNFVPAGARRYGNSGDPGRGNWRRHGLKCRGRPACERDPRW